MGVKLSKQDGAVGAALALAAHYFPTKTDDGRIAGSFKHAAYILGGHLDKWNRWREIGHDERKRIGHILRFAPTDLADVYGFTHAARAALATDREDPGILPFVPAGDPSTAKAAVPRVGGDLLGYVDRLIARLSMDHKRRLPLHPAGPGIHLGKEVWMRGGSFMQASVNIPAYETFTAAQQPELLDFPEVRTADYVPHIDINTRDLLDLAKEIDTKRWPDEPKKRYLHKVLRDLFDQLSTTDTVAPTQLLRLLAGPVETFNAPTGTGKSVLVRVAASWYTVNDRTLTIVLPNVESTLSMAWEISEDLKALGHEGECTPLMSPSRLHERAMKVAARVEGSFMGQDPKLLWKLDRLSYGCALNKVSDPVDAYWSGNETCRHLRVLPPARGLRTCPWMPSCGKFTQQYEACKASVIVTNHHNFMSGKIQIGISLDGRAVSNIPVAELALRRSHTVMIDEVDQFQSTAVDKCSAELVLATRRGAKTALQELDEDAARLAPDSIKTLAPIISHARYLAEYLLYSICTEEIALRHYRGSQEAKKQRPGANSTGWHLAGGRDRRLIALLLPEWDITDEREIPRELFHLLNAVHPPHADNAVDLLDPEEWPELPDHLEQARDVLADFLGHRGRDLLATTKLALARIFTPVIKDAHDRTEAVELLIVRTWLLELDHALNALRGETARLRGSGMQSAAKLAEKLEGGVASDVIPNGMLAKAVVGYRATGLDDADTSGELTSQSLAGDPHTYTAQLGSIVSLVLAGVERPVMGLSATAYFPQAVREHIHGPVKWWMTDAAPESIKAKKNPLDDPISISGQPQFLKKHLLMQLGERLYEEQIHARLEELRRIDQDRAHVAIVANSYEHCVYLAQGIQASSSYRGGVCIAVPPEKFRRDKLPTVPPGAVQLTPEEYETFPQRGTILIVPMARIARGLNIVIGTKSAITDVYVCTRPIALLTDPPEMYASVNASGINAAPTADYDDPTEWLSHARQAAWERLGLILRSVPGFIGIDEQLQEEIVAGMIVDMIQLAGRARRGGTDMYLHLVDAAFEKTSWDSDLKFILTRMYKKWPPHVRRQMNAIYREALAAFLAYAGIDPSDP